MTPGVPPGATEEDAQAVAELCNAFERAFSAEPELDSADDILTWWRRECEARLVLDDGDTLVGIAYCSRRGGRWDGDGYVHPDAFGRGIGTAIVEWIEERARELGAPETRIGMLGAGRACGVPAAQPGVRRRSGASSGW